MSTVDTLLDAAANDGKIIITVDEPSRTLNYDGTILLGVEDDHKAERIYFQAPRYITMDETVDLLSEDIEIYVKYINAENGTYFIQCTDVDEGEDEDTIIFSWIISETVTEVKGKVQFSVWVRKLQRFNEPGEITSLIDTEWDIYDNPNDNSQRLNYPQSFSCVVNFTVPNLDMQFTGMRYVYGGLGNSGTTLTFYTNTNTLYQVYAGDSGWLNEQFQTIKIVGGFDIQNTTLIEFLNFQGKLLSWPDYMTKPPVIFNEWHTTILTGEVLKGIDVSDQTLEIINDETAITYALNQKVEELDDLIRGYTGSYSQAQIDNKINETIETTVKYVDDKIAKVETSLNNLDSSINQELDSKINFNGDWNSDINNIIPIFSTGSNPTIIPSGKTLDNIDRIKTYERLTQPYTTSSITGPQTIDILPYISDYSDVMIVVTGTNWHSNAINVYLLLEDNEKMGNISITANSTTPTYHKININKTYEGYDSNSAKDIYGYDITRTSASSFNFNWVTVTGITRANLMIEANNNEILTGNLNVTVKIYGR